MPVRIPQINIEDMAHAVPARPAFNAAAKAQIAGSVAGSQDLLRIGDGITEVMQTRAGAMQVHQILRIAFAL
ncbi:hypothetical protein D3C74_405900 [compost metagenome]